VHYHTWLLFKMWLLGNFKLYLWLPLPRTTLIYSLSSLTNTDSSILHALAQEIFINCTPHATQCEALRQGGSNRGLALSPYGPYKPCLKDVKEQLVNTAATVYVHTYSYNDVLTLGTQQTPTCTSKPKHSNISKTDSKCFNES
jgi:hypothetical protein